METEWMGVPLAVQHSATLHPERLLVRCELGDLPPDDAERVLRGLLAMQRELAASTPLRLGFDPVSRRVCCSHSMALADASAAVLIEVFEDMVRRAAQWRSTHYLEDDAARAVISHGAEPAGAVPAPGAAERAAWGASR